MLLAALEGRDAGHPLLGPAMASVVVVQGIGRVVTDEQHLSWLIPRLAKDLDRPNNLAALSSLLSRPAQTPGVLATLDVDALAEPLAHHLRWLVENDDFGRRLKYTLLAIAGLLRVRERAPWALVADRSAVAVMLLQGVKDLLTRLQIRINSVPAALLKMEMAKGLTELLSGTGGRPDILSVIDAEE